MSDDDKGLTKDEFFNHVRLVAVVAMWVMLFLGFIGGVAWIATWGAH